MGLLLALGALSASGCGSEENAVNAGTPLCEAGELRCTSTVVEVCRADGDGFQLQEVCSGDTPACVNGACVATACEPASVRCEGNTVVTCAADGLAVTQREPCGVNQRCFDGQCESWVCRPGTHCNTQNQVEVCSADGFTLIETRSCSATERCEDGECQALLCEPNTRYCKEGIPTICSASGSSEASSPCDVGQSCVGDGQCADWVCDAGADYCDGDEPRRCQADGLSSVALPPCVQAKCSAGVCEPWVCEPSADYCEGAEPRSCASDGLTSVSLGAACLSAQACIVGACEDYDGYARGPQPGTPGHPRSYSFDEAAKTVLDNVTGLLWQREPAPSGLTWAQAASYCDDLEWGGRSDWRLPTRMELRSLVDYGRNTPAIDSVAFPSTPSVEFWSATGRTNGNKWCLEFVSGSAYTSSPSASRRVRCVAEDTPQRPIPVSGHFFEVTGGTVVDHATGLEWQRGNSLSTHNHADAVSYCEGLLLDGKADWRLPTVAELSNLVPGRKSASPYTDLTIFPGTQSSFYWTTSQFSGSSAVWVVGFHNGQVGNSPATYAHWVRCVR
ncbi:MAG: DUF1566 domain-containing protein [Polyangiaceae bacterium]|nr:DUF1566 domain-containing protein [Polyangiaceae bacterium]MCW5792241.1 DUF1566 domain-containing protein [Polyangiaceae bacterium]